MSGSSTGRTVVVTALGTTALIGTLFYGLSNKPAAEQRAPVRPSVEPAAYAAPAALPPPTPEPESKETAPPSETPVVASLEEIVSRSMPAVVRVETTNGFGSGFFIRADTVLTNVHVVTTNVDVKLRLADGTMQPARVESTAPEYDIAVLRVPGSASSPPKLTMGSAVRARPGQEVIVLGTPMGLQNTVTRGIVSALRQIGRVTLVQTDAAVNPGNSGGPVLDREGHVVGIATLGAKAGAAQGLSFAVAIDHAEELLSGRRSIPQSNETPLSSLNQSLGAPPAPQAPSESDTRR